MQTLSVGLAAVLVDDETASAIIWYAKLLANERRAECVEIQAYDLNERPVSAQLLLGAVGVVSSVTAFNDLPDPDNAGVLGRILEDTDRIENPPWAKPIEPLPISAYDPRLL